MESCELNSDYARKRPRLQSTPPQTPAPRPPPPYSLPRKPSLARSNSRRLAQGARPWRAASRASSPPMSTATRDTTAALAGPGGARLRGIHVEEMDWSEPYSSSSLTRSQDTPPSFQTCTPSPVQPDSGQARRTYNRFAPMWDSSSESMAYADRPSQTNTDLHGQLPSSVFDVANATKPQSYFQDDQAAAGAAYIVVPVPSSTRGISVRVQVKVDVSGPRV